MCIYRDLTYFIPTSSFEYLAFFHIFWLRLRAGKSPLFVPLATPFSHGLKCGYITLEEDKTKNNTFEGEPQMREESAKEQKIDVQSLLGGMIEV